MTHPNPRRLLVRPVLVLVACLLAIATMLGLRPPSARADDGVCAVGPYTIGVTGPTAGNAVQPAGALLGLRVYTASGDPLASVCGGTPWTFDWTHVDNTIFGYDYLSGSGSQVTVEGYDQHTVTYSVHVRVNAYSLGWGEVTVSYADVAPTGTALASVPAAPDPGQTTTLTATTTSPSGIGAGTWTFGDGDTANTGGTAGTPALSVDHVYRAPGDYTASVVVTDQFGKTDTAQLNVHVRAPLAGGFTASPSTVGVNDPVSVDGSGASTDPGATITGYRWDFGDGHSATGATATHSYAAAFTYTITETVTDSLDRTATATREVIVQNAPPATPPVAAWYVTTAAPVAGSPTAFDGTGSTDHGSITSYRWDFGDGHTGTSATSEHVYAAAGTYSVVLTVTDDAGLTDSATHDVTVGKSSAPPVAAFTANPSSPVAGSPVSFDAGSSTEPGGSLTGFSWAFGDGTTGTGAMQPHTYQTAGTYQVTLTVTDAQGRTATAVRSLSVHWKATDLAVSVSGSAPKAGFYTYRITVRNLGSAAAHGVVLLGTPDSTQVLAAAPSAPSGVRCAGVGIGATGTITCKADPTVTLAAGKAWTVTYTVRQPRLPKPRMGVETSQVKALNPDPISANNTARLSTLVGSL